MKFLSFFEEFPELVEREFRNIIVLDDNNFRHISPGNYAFLDQNYERRIRRHYLMFKNKIINKNPVKPQLPAFIKAMTHPLLKK